MMKYEALGLDGCRTIAEFVENKLARLETMEPGFSSLFPLMFSERDNIMYERSTGYRIRTTSYGEAYAAVLRAVPMLRQALPGLRAQSVVGLYMQNSVEWNWNPPASRQRLSVRLELLQIPFPILPARLICCP